jgi:membrane protein YdbS with pleckstrin-like domain
MGYVDRQLRPGEEVIFRTRLHAVVFAGTAVFAAVVAGIVTLIVARNELAAATVRTLWLAGGAVALLGAAAPYLRWRSAEFAVTTARLVGRVGLLSRDAFAVVLGGVEKIEVEQTFLGRLLDYGTVRLQAPAGAVELPRVARAVALCEAMRGQAAPARRARVR